MKITSIHLYAIHLPLKVPFVVSYQSYPYMPSVIVKMETDEGLIGFGEGVADEHVTGETWESTFQVLKNTLAPLLIGKNPLEIARIHEVMDQAIYGVPTAKAALDIACYDLFGKKVQQPIYQLLGGKYHDEFPITHVLSIAEPERMAEEAAEMVKIGYDSFKMKVGTNVAEDVRRIAAVRDAVGESVAIRVDVNQGWRSSSATLSAMSQLASCNLDWLEQIGRAHV